MTEGILVFTQEEVLRHKLKDGKRKDYAYCYWEISKYPKRFDEEIEGVCISNSPRIGYSVEKLVGCDDYAINDDPGDEEELIDVRKYDIRLYIAVKGKVVGYFWITAITKSEDKSYNTLRFHSDDWCEIKDGEILIPSQGWRYYKK